MVNKKSKPDREYITSLERGLAVLKCFSRENPEMTISEIAAMTDLNPAVVRRCLHTLLHLGYIGKRNKLFLLKPRVMSLGSAFLESMNVEEAFRPALQQLSDRTGDSTSLSVLVDNDIIFLIYVSTAPTIHYYVGVGKRCPAYVTALGRALLAYKPKQELEEYLKSIRIKIYTDRTVTSVSKLRAALSNVRRDGYVCVHGEFDPLIVSLATPIFGPDGVPVASINCSTSTTRADEAQMIEKRLPLLLETAQKIEMELRRFPALAHSIRAQH